MFAFCPAYEPSDEPQPIRIVFDGMPGFITTTLVALTLDDAERSRTRLNARLDLDRDAWWAIVARSMRARATALTPGPWPAPRGLGVDTMAGSKSVYAAPGLARPLPSRRPGTSRPPACRPTRGR